VPYGTHPNPAIGETSFMLETLVPMQKTSEGNKNEHHEKY
jgi:hypothetical protein